MFVPDKLKLNKFRLCATPSPRTLFQRFGFSTPVGGSYSGDEVMPMSQRKVDSIADFARYNDSEVARDVRAQAERESESRETS